MKEVDDSKENVILINKADLLTVEQRSAWATYFEKEDVKIIFWSALAAAIQPTGDSEVTWGAFSDCVSGRRISVSFVFLTEGLWESRVFVCSLNVLIVG